MLVFGFILLVFGIASFVFREPLLRWNARFGRDSSDRVVKLNILIAGVGSVIAGMALLIAALV